VTLQAFVAYYSISKKSGKKVGLGLDAQKAVVNHFAQVDQAEIVKEFIEQRDLDMDEKVILQEAIKYSLKHQAIFVVAKIDMLSTDITDIVILKRKLGKLFKSCDLPTSDSLTLSIYSGLLEREKLLASIRTKAALQTKKEEGYILGNPKNFTTEGRQLGLAKLKKNTRKNEYSKRALKFIVRRKKAGLGYGMIAKELNLNGFASPRGKRFHKSTVRRLYKKWLEDNQTD